MRIIQLLVVLFCMVWSFAGFAADSQPNIVFILADDLGWADVAFHGGNAPTPHLDKLCTEGLELTQHYVAPVCSPTRAGFLTGRCWSRYGVNSPTNERAFPWDTVTLPKALQSVGYETCLVGKWHEGSKPEWGPNHYGFDHSYGSLAGGVGPWNHRYKQGPYSVTWHRNEVLLEEPGHVTDLLTREALEWLGKRNGRPFFLYVPFTAVHLPIKEPEEWLARVPADIPAGVPRQYAACIMHLDNAVGQILDALDTTGKRDNTLLIFTSDNGGSTAQNNDTRYPDDVYPTGKLPGNNSPWRGQKGTLYEGGIRVPTIVSWPGRIEAGKCDEPLHITDWMPTFCGLAGYQPQSDLRWDGSDIWECLTEQKPRSNHPLYWVGSDSRSKAVRNGDWKLIHHVDRDGTQKTELFNLAEDSKEDNNLAASMPEHVAQLQQLMDQLGAANNDSVVGD